MMQARPRKDTLTFFPNAGIGKQHERDDNIDARG
jgi:hypothetical protein